MPCCTKKRAKGKRITNMYKWWIKEDFKGERKRQEKKNNFDTKGVWEGLRRLKAEREKEKER